MSRVHASTRQRATWQNLAAKLEHCERSIKIGETQLKLSCLADLEQAYEESFKAIPQRDRDLPGNQSKELNPYFGIIWPAAVALASHLDLLLRTRERPETSLELGCGLALPSLVAASHGLTRVIATDRHPMVPQYLDRNCALNKLPALEYQSLDWRHISAPAGLPAKGFANLILGSDLLYEAWQPGFLATAVAHLLADGGSALIADPGRHHVDEFLTLCEANGLSCLNLHLHQVTLGDRPTDVLIIELQRL